MTRRPLGRLGRFRVMLVDGERIRDRIFTDFTMGGNPARYPSFVPAGELWIDRAMSPHDQAATVLHEFVETALMQECMPYSKAHDLATGVETRFRRGKRRRGPVLSRVKRALAKII